MLNQPAYYDFAKLPPASMMPILPMNADEMKVTSNANKMKETSNANEVVKGTTTTKSNTAATGKEAVSNTVVDDAASGKRRRPRPALNKCQRRNFFFRFF